MRLGRLRDEVEDAVRDLALERDRVRLLGVDEVRELDRVADEEDAEVVADEVPVAVLGVELDREAARVADRLGGVAPAGHGGEAQRDVGALARLLEELGAGELGDRLVADLARGLEVAERGRAARVDDALRDALAVEVAHLLEEVVVLERRRTARRRPCAGSGCRRRDDPDGWSGPCAPQLMCVLPRIGSRGRGPRRSPRPRRREAARPRRVQARGGARDAVDVDGQAAGAADEVVVVVAGARLVARRAARKRDAAREAALAQRLADVVGGLRGDAQPARADALDHLVDARMVIGVGQHAQDGDARRGDAKARPAQALLDLSQRHDPRR